MSPAFKVIFTLASIPCTFVFQNTLRIHYLGRRCIRLHCGDNSLPPLQIPLFSVHSCDVKINFKVTLNYTVIQIELRTCERYCRLLQICKYRKKDPGVHGKLRQKFILRRPAVLEKLLKKHFNFKNQISNNVNINLFIAYLVIALLLRWLI